MLGQLRLTWLLWVSSNLLCAWYLAIGLGKASGKAFWRRLQKVTAGQGGL